MKPSKEPKSEEPIIQAPQGLYPVCRCGGEIKQVKYLDYEDIRVVFHADGGCVIGVMESDL